MLESSYVNGLQGTIQYPETNKNFSVSNHVIRISASELRKNFFIKLKYLHKSLKYSIWFETWERPGI